MHYDCQLVSSRLSFGNTQNLGSVSGRLNSFLTCTELDL